MLTIKVPKFSPDPKENQQHINEVMIPFLKEYAKKEALEREIGQTDDAIDKKVYALYGLTDEEIKIIKTHIS